MSGYERQQVSTLLARLDEPPSRLIVVSGPRQTGKTTAVRQVLSQVNMAGTYVSVDERKSESLLQVFERQEQVLGAGELRDAKWLTRIWELARIEADRADRGYVLVLDEIQKVPQWSEVVKGLWDADRAAQRHLHVVVLGSAPLILQQGLTESLAGRFELIRFNHWSFQEMVEAFDFDLSTFIYFGGYPGAAPQIGDQPRWREYIRSSLIEPNIERDILSMVRVNKPVLLKRAFELGSSYSGQILSYTKMVGQLQDAGNTTTLAHYLDLLSTAGMLTGIQKYAGQKHRQRGSSPKLNVLNTAFMSVNSGYTFEEAKADRTFWGRLVESTVGAHLFNSGAPEVRLHYWRESPHEVDFVLQQGSRIVSIEVKSTSRRVNQSGMAEFQNLFNPQRSVLVGENGIPLEQFLLHPAAYWFE